MSVPRSDVTSWVDLSLKMNLHQYETIQNNTTEQLIYKTVFNEYYVEMTAPVICSCWCCLDAHVYCYLNWQNDQHTIKMKSCGRRTVDPGNECTAVVLYSNQRTKLSLTGYTSDKDRLIDCTNDGMNENESQTKPTNWKWIERYTTSTTTTPFN